MPKIDLTKLPPREGTNYPDAFKHVVHGPREDRARQCGRPDASSASI